MLKSIAFACSKLTCLHIDSGVASALAGLDMTMPDSGWWAKNLTTAIQNGTVPESRLDDMATR